MCVLSSGSVPIGRSEFGQVSPMGTNHSSNVCTVFCFCSLGLVFFFGLISVIMRMGMSKT